MGTARPTTQSDRPARGAVSNPSGRFELQRLEALDATAQENGRCPEATLAWAGGDGPTDPLVAGAPPTQVAKDHAKSIISRNESPDIPFSQSINPYRGCEHGCIYCFARPTHAWLGLSPGLDFETKLFVKQDAAVLLRKELRKKGYQPEPLALGANTDPYQPIERRFRITRELLELLEQCRHPVMIVTKSDLVLRDLDLLEAMAARGLVSVALSLATLDPQLAQRLDPRAPIPMRRLVAMERLADAGVPVTVLASPMIPGLNDHELEEILAAAWGRGAKGAGYSLLRLPLELKELFSQWLDTHYPLRAAKIFAQLRDSHEGAVYRSAFGERLRGRGPYASMIEARFAAARRRLGLAKHGFALDQTQFTKPAASTAQMSLF